MCRLLVGSDVPGNHSGGDVLCCGPIKELDTWCCQVIYTALTAQFSLPPKDFKQNILFDLMNSTELVLLSFEFLIWHRKPSAITSVTVIINSLLNKALCCLKGHEGRGESCREKREEGGVPSTTPCHHVLGVPPEQLQGSAETEEGLGDPTNQRGRKFSRTIPSDARQRKWQIWWAASLIRSEFTAGISWGHFMANADCGCVMISDKEQKYINITGLFSSSSQMIMLWSPNVIIATKS